MASGRHDDGQLRELAAKNLDFGTKSTLAVRADVPLIEKWREESYRFRLFYVWLPSAEMAVERVASRVRSGGGNFIETYRHRADFWTVLDNSASQYQVVARGQGEETEVYKSEVWEKINQ